MHIKYVGMSALVYAHGNNRVLDVFYGSQILCSILKGWPTSLAVSVPTNIGQRFMKPRPPVFYMDAGWRFEFSCTSAIYPLNHLSSPLNKVLKNKSSLLCTLI